MKTKIDYAALELAFTRQKAMKIHDQRKLKAGTWIEVKWNDAPNNLVLLLEKPFTARKLPIDRARPAFDFSVWDPVTKQIITWLDCQNVVRVHSQLEVPALVIGPKQ